MPKETLKDGDIYILTPGEKILDVNGKDTGRRIYSRRKFDPDNPNVTEDDLVVASPSVDIHWTKMEAEPGFGAAQLSVTIPVEMVEEALADEYRPDPSVVRFFTDDLSRAELNRMVRLARHVRDSAHGRDE
jgi:hypothetical protein